MLTYRKTTEADKYRIAGWRYDGDYAVYNLAPYEEQKETHSGLANGRNKYYSFFDADGLLVGFVNLVPEPGEVFVGVGVSPERCGQGVGTEMLRLTAALAGALFPGKPLYLEVRTWNRRAVRCYEKAGFTIDGPPFSQTTPIGTGTFYRMCRPAMTEGGIEAI